MDAEYIESIEEFLRAEFARPRIGDRAVVFRGHASSEYKLVPVVFRGSSKPYERRMLSELVGEVPNKFDGDGTTLDRMVRAQHYGLPTRLLDVSLNPLIALYFACVDKSDADGHLVRFEVDASRVKSYDSDAISCCANLALLTPPERDSIFKYIKNNRKNDKIESIAVANFNRIKEIKKLVDLVRVEKPYFKNMLKPQDVHQFFLVSPKMSSKRIIAQSGAFFMSGLVYNMEESPTSAIKINKYKIEKSTKKV